ncbi:MAG: mechanosensitive ion channel [Desulfamplus sp.]|nr:mechanosensitive ion channel [Desulfamplus sp.]
MIFSFRIKKILLVSIIFITLFTNTTLLAQEKSKNGSQTKIENQTKDVITQAEPEKKIDSDINLNRINETQKILEQIALIEKSIELENRELTEIGTYLDDTKSKKRDFESQINGYKIELTTFGSQLNLPDIDTKLLEKAYMSSQAAVNKITNELAKLQAKSEQLKQSELTASEQKSGNEKFLASSEKLSIDVQLADEKKLLDKKSAEEEQQITKDKIAALKQLKTRLGEIQSILTKKIGLLKSTVLIVDEKIVALKDLEDKYKNISIELEARIRDSKKAELLTRTNNPLTQNTWKRIGDDTKELLSIAKSLFEKDSWKNSFSFLWLAGLHKLIPFLVILLFVSIVAIRFKVLIKKFCSASPLLAKRYWSKITLQIFGKNLLLSTITTFFYLCLQFKLFFSYSIVANLIVEILMILIFILWLIYFIEHIEKKYPEIPVKELIIFLKALNLVAIIYILLGSTLKIDNSIVIGYRLLCEILFYGWLIYFFKKLMPTMTRFCEKQNRTIQMIPSFYKNGVILAAIVGIILEIMGYGTLAFYWYISWGKTVVVLMWSALIIGASGEWIDAASSTLSSDSNQKDSYQNQTGEQGKNSFSTLWLIRKILLIAMFFIVTIALMLSWASSDFVFSLLYKILSFKFTVGSMSFSLFSTLEAIAIIIITNMVAKSWRSFFNKNFLKESGLDQGLQESMTTITLYSIWIFGIFTSLIVFGLNTTTLTVAFGALSIGIGFGLQNIVSNFISGIILLFERPIQVGDDIEVNGTWATVRKTNVRSTIVQTYDNATIIIPNSELISNRVINWSFKDRRLRRKIKVGVEYGSDIELVRSTLLEIINSTPRVLKFPEPDVLFEDFADSALIFSVRFWTFTDYFLTVETDVRFKIDKIFKKRGIVIAFPQQDIHIKTMPINQTNLVAKETI